MARKPFVIIPLGLGRRKWEEMNFINQSALLKIYPNFQPTKST
jgi:hypothetical protein